MRADLLDAGVDASPGPALTPIVLLLPEEIVQRLLDIKGVEAALLAGPQGHVLACAGGTDPERLAAVAAFVGGEASSLGLGLSLGSFRRVSVQMGRQRIIVLPFGQGFAGLRIAETAVLETVCAEIHTLLGRK